RRDVDHGILACTTGVTGEPFGQVCEPALDLGGIVVLAVLPLGLGGQLGGGAGRGRDGGGGKPPLGARRWPAGGRARRRCQQVDGVAAGLDQRYGEREPPWR